MRRGPDQHENRGGWTPKFVSYQRISRSLNTQDFHALRAFVFSSEVPGKRNGQRPQEVTYHRLGPMDRFLQREAGLKSALYTEEEAAGNTSVSHRLALHYRKLNFVQPPGMQNNIERAHYTRVALKTDVDPSFAESTDIVVGKTDIRVERNMVDLNQESFTEPELAQAAAADNMIRPVIIESLRGRDILEGVGPFVGVHLHVDQRQPSIELRYVSLEHINPEKAGVAVSLQENGLLSLDVVGDYTTQHYSNIDPSQFDFNPTIDFLRASIDAPKEAKILV